MAVGRAEIPLIAVVGNPNAGKTTLFNSLTGSRQKVGNYPGVTVEKVSASVKLGDQVVEFVDVPGLYSLEPESEDEAVAVGVLTGEFDRKPDLVLAVVSAANLERNLFFFSQLAEEGFPLVVALTMTDLAESSGRPVNVGRLARLLGVEVVPVVGHKGKGLDALQASLERNLAKPRRAHSPSVETEVVLLVQRLSRSGIDLDPEEGSTALRTQSHRLDGQLADSPELLAALSDGRKRLAVGSSESIPTAARYEWAASIVKQAVTEGAPKRSATVTDRIDAILTHKALGMIVFFGLMYLVFQSIYSFATPFMDLIETGFGALGDWAGSLFGEGMIRDLVVDGVIGGVGTVLVFLPQILILFFFIAVLEGTGYLARAAFLMDRLLGWCGLNGRAFIPLLSSYACAVPGILSARVMPDPKSRLATILVAPLMSCSARLPVYIVLIGAFIEPKFGAGWAGFTLFALHLLGLFVAIPVVFILNRGVIKGKRLPFLLELPPYQIPRWKDVWLAMFSRGKVFVQTAGTIILFMSVLIWGLTYFPRTSVDEESFRAEFVRVNPGAEENEISHFIEERRLENSYLGRFGKVVEPVFRPAGFDWRITTSILAAFPAREVVVPSLGVLFRTGGGALDDDTDLRQALNSATWPDGRPLMTPYTAIGLMVFFALCAQCMATLAAAKRETNTWKWPVFMFVYMTALAYLGAVLVNQIGIRFGGA